ncbi:MULTISPECIES: hypothetical protein [Streptomyces]|uniref:Uncharacterized protein n=1 Tax=Streptomyces rimosus subsp. rimosus (strain ATCC 10970 / DSM 40260 / JCM 4667 / NRRL 2234) TaxID=1265868 RepID=A0A8A1UGT9_STRR1|nr:MULTISPECIES: hypothetical protein [Streptomyces]MYT42202.1 hypothetical protein [Streptomyces sp. SID5471]QST78871.1 hypothetical protein SRIM_000550 [Streptomyces rimosus subsp. rimosus ATCC 10970]QTL91237.1 hypothetical protein FMM49_41030 [Streptomyces rimosus subsp. rimosus]
MLDQAALNQQISTKSNGPSYCSISVAPSQWAERQDTVKGPALDRHTTLGIIRMVHNDDRGGASDVASALVETGNPDGVSPSAPRTGT